MPSRVDNQGSIKYSKNKYKFPGFIENNEGWKNNLYRSGVILAQD